MTDGKKHIAIGFATGRIGFKNVLHSYIYHLKESHSLSDHQFLLSLFVAYDPSYNNTKKEDYDDLSAEEREAFYLCRFIGPDDIEKEKQQLVKDSVLTKEEAAGVFGTGYAMQRNIILYEALRENVDGIIFLDDDEYPMAVTESSGISLWSGQNVLEEHIRYLQFSDITNGYHCGYLTPVPSIDFDGILSKEIFHRFTDALSSDVLKWDEVEHLIASGGVTYADKTILREHQAKFALETNGAKFISGGNLGINLTKRTKVLPFYNPPEARGEDSILSTCLDEYNVKWIPVYTFHDGFSFYESLLRGVLPLKLKQISLYDSAAVNNRFYKACLGWARYKPLYTYLTQPDSFTEIMDQSLQNLQECLPSICSYFNDRRYLNLFYEMEKYVKNVPNHNQQFHDLQKAWKKMIKAL